MLTLPFPERREEILKFVKHHHYSHRCPGVWSVAYAQLNRRGRIQAVLIYGPAPYPGVTRAFCRVPEHARHVAWQARMIAAGISSTELDALLAFANANLLLRGYWWVYTLTEPQAWVVDGALVRLLCPGFAGETYFRNGWHYLGATKPSSRELFIVDGRPVHIRQNDHTLTESNIRAYFPDAREIRPVMSRAKDRWANVLATSEIERAERVLLMKFHPQPWTPATQPRLLCGPQAASMLVPA
jgi:hypothetical protein